MRKAGGVQRTIGRRYNVHERVGQGGMGYVYRALDRLNEKIVALKQVQTSGLMFDMTLSQNVIELRIELVK